MAKKSITTGGTPLDETSHLELRNPSLVHAVDEHIEEKSSSKRDRVPARVSPDLSNVQIGKVLAWKQELNKITGVTRRIYLCRFREISYRHCAQVTSSQLMDLMGKNASSMLSRFHTSHPHPVLDFEQVIVEEHKQVDRVLASRCVPQHPEHIEYLVKWGGLGYADATWEYEHELVQDSKKIDEFLERHPTSTTSSLTSMVPVRPAPSEWQPISKEQSYKNENRLRPWQVDGVSWLLYCWYHRRGCILADEMGLGKTVQIVACLVEVFKKRPGPYLIVAPLSTLGHWQREFELWSDLNAVVYHGSRIDREVLRQYEWYSWDEKGNELRTRLKFDVLICTYESLAADYEILSKLEWRFLVVDEGHRLKNAQSKGHQLMMNLHTEHRVILTGTPIQNNLEELYTLLHFVNPLSRGNTAGPGSREEFLRRFGDLRNADQVEQLQVLLQPVLLRRLKEDVAKDLPAKEEIIIQVELTGLQKQYYRAILEGNRDFLTRGARAPQLLNIFMQLRKCCNHPFLIEGAEQRSYELDPTSDRLSRLISSSGKMVLIDKFLPKLQRDGHKVLIFSQMKKVLDLVGQYLELKQYAYERIDGDVRGLSRQRAIDRFNSNESNTFVFLLCTRAGGVGINLTAADHCIIFDSDWNPQNDKQAQARCHRIGQTQQVKVYRLVTARTYEKEMFERSSKKLGLDQAILVNLRQQTSEGTVVDENEPRQKLQKKEIDLLLRKGAYELFGTEDEEDKVAKQFCEADIDEILEKRTSIRRDEKTVVGTSNFSKATFESEASDARIDINDADFWEKMLPDTTSPLKLYEKLEQDKSFLTQPEEKAQFLEWVKYNFQQVIESQEAGIPSDSFVPLLNLLGLMHSLDEFHQEKETIYEWQQDLENPRKRRRKKSASSSSRQVALSLLEDVLKEEFEASEEMKDETETGASNRRSSTSKVAKKENKFGNCVFPPSEARILRERILAIASTQRTDAAIWKEIMKYRQDEMVRNQTRSVEEIIAYTLCYLNLCIEQNTKQEESSCKKKTGLSPAEWFIQARYRLSNVVSELLDTCPIEWKAKPSLSLDIATPQLEWFPSLQDTRVADHIGKHSPRWIRHFAIVSHLWSKLSDCNDPLVELQIPSTGRHVALMAPSYWSRECDKHLLVGVCRYGLGSGALESIRSDPSLIFSGLVKTLEDFPHMRGLELRIQALLYELERQEKRNEQEKQKVQRQKEKDQAAKQAKLAKEEKESWQWSRSERRSVLKSIFQFGDQSASEWERVRAVVPKKSPQAIVEYWIKFKTQLEWQARHFEVEREHKETQRLLEGSEQENKTPLVKAKTFCVCKSSSAGCGMEEMEMCTNCYVWYHCDCLKERKEEITPLAIRSTSKSKKEQGYICALCNQSKYDKRRRRETARQKPSRPPWKGIRPSLGRSMGYTLVAECRVLLNELYQLDSEAFCFSLPVDPIAEGVPGYFDVIHRPLDFSTIQLNLEAKAYETVDHFVEDLWLVFRNCWQFNGKQSQITKQARDLSCLVSKWRRELDQSLLEERQSTEFPSGEVVDRDLTEANAFKCLERIEIIQSLKQCQKLQELLDEKLEDLPKGLASAPAWWRPHIHDKALFEAILKYGFGQKQEILKDEKFRVQFYDDQGELAKDRLKFLNLILEDRAPLTKRLIYMTRLVLQEYQVEAMRNRLLKQMKQFNT